MKPNVVIINEMDNVAVVLEDVKKGDAIHLPDGEVIAARSDIPYSHKVAVANIKAGGYVYKYGEVIGAVKEDVMKGDWIHTHNLDIDAKVEV
jgi:altronate dehydratase